MLYAFRIEQPVVFVCALSLDLVAQIRFQISARRYQPLQRHIIIFVSLRTGPPSRLMHHSWRSDRNSPVRIEISHRVVFRTPRLNICEAVCRHALLSEEVGPITDQQRRKACEAVAHQCTSGSGMARANPARNTGCANPSGATSAAAPSGTPSTYRTLPSATI